MKLISVHIQNFKCIRDSGEFRIDPAVTSLVGKNESGKTAILQALEKLNPLDNQDGSFDELEYPRSKLTEFRDLPKDTQSHALITKWKLEPADTEAVSNVLGNEAMKSTEITITKGYYDSTIWDFQCDEVKGFSHLLTTSELHEEEKTPLRAAGSIAAAMAELEAKQPATEPNVTNPRSPREEALLEALQELFPKERKTIWQAIVDILSQRLPKMVYFSEYLRMPGQVSLNDLKTRKGAKDEPGSKVFAALLAMIGRTIDDLETIGEFERLQAELEAASNRLTKEIFRYWTQNRHLRVQFRFEQGMPNDPAPFGSGYVMRTRIENTRHGVTTSFDDRSAGFVWFFSFLVWFSQVRKHYGENLVILLDEPGLSLHAKAQADLLRYIDERLAVSNLKCN